MKMNSQEMGRIKKLEKELAEARKENAELKREKFDLQCEIDRLNMETREFINGQLKAFNKLMERLRDAIS